LTPAGGSFAGDQLRHKRDRSLELSSVQPGNPHSCSADNVRRGKAHVVDRAIEGSIRKSLDLARSFNSADLDGAPATYRVGHLLDTTLRGDVRVVLPVDALLCDSRPDRAPRRRVVRGGSNNLRGWNGQQAGYGDCADNGGDLRRHLLLGRIKRNVQTPGCALRGSRINLGDPCGYGSRGTRSPGIGGISSDGDDSAWLPLVTV